MLGNPLISGCSSSAHVLLQKKIELEVNWSVDHSCSMKIFIQGNTNCTFNFGGKYYVVPQFNITITFNSLRITMPAIPGIEYHLMSGIFSFIEIVHKYFVIQCNTNSFEFNHSKSVHFEDPKIYVYNDILFSQ